MLNPGLAAGVTIGVICHMVSPQWLIIVMLIITLVLALQKSLTKGIQQFKKESKMLADLAEQQRNNGGAPPGGGLAAQNIKIRLADFPTFGSLAVSYSTQLMLIF